MNVGKELPPILKAIGRSMLTSALVGVGMALGSEAIEQGKKYGQDVAKRFRAKSGKPTKSRK